MSDVQSRPIGQLKTTRSLLKYILLSIVTLGIYSLVFWYCVGDDMNVLASRHDGRRTMNYALVAFLLSPITLGIMFFVWCHGLLNRMGAELARRGINYSVDASTFWLWCVLGSLIIVGPFIYTHKVATAMNLLAEDYNMNG
ncbi:MAG: DUF4234 domain-containing protein [Oscillospiraceae bacterium]|nr:DUF4234 domain-containing protein [Oscillospiraceae bacterium]